MMFTCIVGTRKPESSEAVTKHGLSRLPQASSFATACNVAFCRTSAQSADRLDYQDVVSFTGSADTARMLRSNPALMENGVRGYYTHLESLSGALATRSGPSSSTGSPITFMIRPSVSSPPPHHHKRLDACLCTGQTDRHDRYAGPKWAHCLSRLPQGRHHHMRRQWFACGSFASQPCSRS